MNSMRTASLVVALVVAGLLAPVDGYAQGRGRGGGAVERQTERGAERETERGTGPAFCRNGQGHPVHGWRWCEEKGWADGVRRQGDPRGDARRLDNVADARGYADGYEKGFEDGQARRSADPARHRWYRDGDRGYDGRDGARAAYQAAYRDAFRSGYGEGFRDGERAEATGGFRLPWPF